MAVGAALAASGAAYQGLFRNPLVSPDILGVSSGAALGAVLGIYCSLPVLAIQAMAFAGGLAAVAIVYLIAAAIPGRDPVLVLVLGGVVIGALLGSGVALLKFLADPYNQLPAITFWLLGSLSAVNRADLASLVPPVLVALVPLVLLRWRLDVMTLGDEEATALGVDTRWLRAAVIAGATLNRRRRRCRRDRRLGRAHRAASRAPDGRAGLRPPAAGRRAARRRLPARGRHRGAHARPHRAAARRAHRGDRHAGLPLAPGQGTARLDVMLAVENLAFGYGSRAVGADVSLAVAAGEALCLLGPNGGGKSTLFKTVLGLLPPIAGRVLVEDEDCAAWSARRRARAFG
jgi:ABC-type multidrug transport system fused ATPase/permease subunit